jgi:hypothetical protein
MSAESLRQEILNWKKVIAVAMTHPTLPEGTHLKQLEKVRPELQRLYSLVFQLYTAEDHAVPFREPVNALLLDASVQNYYDRITRPMSLREVLDKLAGGKYETAAAAFSDINLIWANCLTFNGPQHPLSREAEWCRDWLNTQYREVEASMPASVARVERLLQRIQQSRSASLINDIREAVERTDKSLIVDDEIEFGSMQTGLLMKLEDIVAKAERPGSALSRTGRHSPEPR